MVRVLYANSDVINVASVVPVKPACAYTQFVRNKRQIDGCTGARAHPTAAVNILHIPTNLRIELRQLGPSERILNQPTHRTCAIERTLRTSEDLDALYIIRHQVDSK